MPDPIQGAVALHEAVERWAEGQLEGALELLENASSGGSELPVERALRAMVLLSARRCDEAWAVFEELAAAHPHELPLRLNAGMAALGCGRLERARDHLRWVVGRQPNHRRAFAHLARVHLGLGETELARAALLEAELSVGLTSGSDGVAEPPPPDALARAADALGPTLDEVLAQALRGAFCEAPAFPPVWRGTHPEASEVSFIVGVSPTAEAGAWLELRSEETARGWREAGVNVRSSHLLVCEGAWRSEELRVRSQGRVLGAWTGPSGRMSHLRGRGRLLCGTGPSRSLQVIELRASVAYLREDALVAFSEGLSWENGGLPPSQASGIPMVRLSGTGRVALECSSPLRVWETGAHHASLVRRRSLVGWIGDVVPLPTRPDSCEEPVDEWIQCVGVGRLMVAAANAE
ncbi:MAG: hypothetical protein IT371_26345 [Deltaproteobacteria bacterium]|nr:hypothetical protein [Deltaproteobacteria bacterium]